MTSANAAGWGRRAFLLFTVILFLVHAALLLAAKSPSAVSLVSNSIQLVFGLAATVATANAARRMTHFGRHFWIFISSGFLIWSAAQAFVTYYDSIEHAPLQQPWPSDVFFFLSMAPAFMTLFIDSEKGLEWKDWPRILDLAQVVILTVAAYLLTFASPAHWKMAGGELARFAWVPDCGRDVFLFAAFCLRAAMARQKLSRDLYARMAIFFGLYLAGEAPYLYLQATRNLPSGTLWDLGWSLPFLGIVLLAATSQPIREEVIVAGPRRGTTTETLGHWGLVHIVPMVVPLVVLLMAAGFAEKQFGLAVAMVLASFACSSARIVFGQRERRQIDVALEEKNVLLKSIFEGTDDAIYIRDLEGRYVIVNPAFTRFFDKPAAEIVGKTAAQLLDFANARRTSETDRAVVESGQTQSFEYEIPLKTGTRAFLTMKSPYRDGEGKVIGVIAISRDITEYRAMESRLRQSQKMEAIGTLAGGVAHDFNNLLMVIAGYGSVLRDAVENNPSLRAHVEQIQKASERAAALTRQLLAFSRKQTIQPVPLNLNGALGGIEKLLRRLIVENIAIVTRFAPDLGTIKADVGQIEQVILNLAVNARDAMPEGGRLTLETRNREVLRTEMGAREAIKPGRYVELSVSDTGVGMATEIQAHIFEPYFTTKPTGKGTGLGLSTVYGIVQQSGGYVTFSSEKGVGTTFRVLLPRIDSAQAPVSALEAPGASYTGVETVLLAEDEPAVCDLVRAILISRGYSVLSARLPQEAEAISESHQGKIDLLLTDVIMPGMSGAELAKRIVAKIPGIKVLFMSGYIDDSIVREGIRESEASFLQKPFTPISLARKVREALDGAAVR